jgi:intraflagellar transport protein 46
VEVTSVEAVDKSDQVRKIATWIQSIADLHKNKPRPVIAYTKNMPEIEDLMQVHFTLQWGHFTFQRVVFTVH